MYVCMYVAAVDGFSEGENQRKQHQETLIQQDARLSWLLHRRLKSY